MVQIKFSAKYKKMPKNLDATYIIEVKKTRYSDLSEDFIKADTEKMDGTFYPLPKGDLLIIKLYTRGHVWQTVRPWNEEKEIYYRMLVGKEVEIDITEGIFDNSISTLQQAARLAKWLIEVKGKDPTTAYVIAKNKYKLENWHDVQKYYNQNLKDKQLKIIT